MGKTEKSSRKSKSAWASLKGQSPTPYRRRSKLETATDLDIFARTLHRLDENCKKTIDSLTQAAMELEKDGLEKDIVIAMQIHILTAPPRFVVPCLFTMDSIMKNSVELAGRNTNYPELIWSILACVVADLLNKPLAVSDKQLVFRTRLTWKGIIPDGVLKKIDEAVKLVDPRWQPEHFEPTSLTPTQPPTSKNSATNNVRKFKTALREKDRIEIAARNAGLEQRGVQSSTTVHVPVGAGSPPDRKRRLSYEEEDDRRAPKLARNEFLSGHVGKSDTRPALAHGHAPVAVVARAVKVDQKSLIAAKMDDLAYLMESSWRVTPLSNASNVTVNIDEESDISDSDGSSVDSASDVEVETDVDDDEEAEEQLETDDEDSDTEDEELLSDTESPEEEKIAAILYDISNL